jgi:hypothetical protein
LGGLIGAGRNTPVCQPGVIILPDQFDICRAGLVRQEIKLTGASSRLCCRIEIFIILPAVIHE